MFAAFLFIYFRTGFFSLVAALLEEEAKGSPETSLRSARGRGALLAIGRSSFIFGKYSH